MNSYTPIITCEHAGNRVPEPFLPLFANQDTELNSHRGWDPGAWNMAVSLARLLRTEAHGCHTTRLLIEPNRSIDSDQLFSHLTRHLPATEKQNLIDTIYLPYRNRVEKAIAEAQKPTLHLSIHTFTPVFNNQTRTVDIGLLFDPGRHSEKEFCEAFIHKLSDQFPHLTLRFNEPYQGIDDGLTTYLRTRFDASAYLGIEIEVNQKWCAAAQDMAKGLATALWQ